MLLKKKLIIGSILLAVAPITIAGLLVGKQASDESVELFQERSKAHLIAMREMKKS